MPELTPGARGLMGYWGVIQRGVSERLSTADLWDALHQAAAEVGATLPSAGAIDLGQLRSLAVQTRNAMESLGGAADQLDSTGIDPTISADHIGTAPWSRSLADQSLAPAWEVRFEQTLVQGGVEQTLWRTSLFEGSLPTTTGDLLDQLTSDAEDMADSYGATHVSIGAVSIVAV